MDSGTGEMARWVQVVSVVWGPELDSWNSCKCPVGYRSPQEAEEGSLEQTILAWPVKLASSGLKQESLYPKVETNRERYSTSQPLTTTLNVHTRRYPHMQTHIHTGYMQRERCWVILVSAWLRGEPVKWRQRTWLHELHVTLCLSGFLLW